MSHRKFEAPRHGSLGFLPRKRCKKGRGRIRSFPEDNATQAPHLTAFIAYKAGNTHVLRDVVRPGSKLNKNEAVEAVTILEAPPMTVVGIVGYMDTPKGLRAVTSVWTTHLSDEVKRRFYKNWYKCKKKAFTKYAKKAADGELINQELQKMEQYCTVIRVLAHTQISKLKLRQKKAHLMEIQINGGDVAAKIAYSKSLMEQDIRVDDVFSTGECIDTIGITKGKGFKGVVSRWGVTRLPRKTHRGLERLLVSQLGIQPEFPSALLELVKRVTITELTSTRESTESVTERRERVPTCARLTEVPLRLIQLQRRLLQWEDSLTTDKSTRIS